MNGNTAVRETYGYMWSTNPDGHQGVRSKPEPACQPASNTSTHVCKQTRTQRQACMTDRQTDKRGLRTERQTGKRIGAPG